MLARFTGPGRLALAGFDPFYERLSHVGSGSIDVATSYGVGSHLSGTVNVNGFATGMEWLRGEVNVNGSEHRVHHVRGQVQVSGFGHYIHDVVGDVYLNGASNVTLRRIVGDVILGGSGSNLDIECDGRVDFSGFGGNFARIRQRVQGRSGVSLHIENWTEVIADVQIQSAGTHGVLIEGTSDRVRLRGQISGNGSTEYAVEDTSGGDNSCPGLDIGPLSGYRQSPAVVGIDPNWPSDATYGAIFHS